MNLVTLLIRVGGMTLLSRIFGFIRDAMMARIFGAGMASDAFLAAFRIPNLLRRISAEGAFSQAFVPVFAEYVSLRQPSDTRPVTELHCDLLRDDIGDYHGAWHVGIALGGDDGSTGALRVISINSR